MQTYTRTILSAALALAFTGGAGAQTANLSLSLTLPPPVPITLPVNQTLTIGGITYQVTGTLTLTPASVPAPTPPPVTSGITSVTDAANQPLTTAPAGTLLVIHGTGLGQFGSATVAGLPAPVQSWTPTTVTVKLPAGGSATGIAIGPVALQPGDAPPTATSFDFTITGLSAALPPVPGPSWISTVLSVSQTLNDPLPNPDACGPQVVETDY